MARGRPLEFDRATALRHAMEMFWAEGFEATSLRGLLKRMGIGRQSVYNTFGDKRSLFLKAIAHYQDTVVQGLVEALRAEGSPQGNLRRLILDAARTDVPTARWGCLCVNTMAGRGGSDPEVAAMMRRHVDRLIGAVRDAIGRAQAAGEVAAAVDALAVARAIVNAVNGLAMLQRIGADAGMLSDVADGALALLGRS